MLRLLFLHYFLAPHLGAHFFAPHLAELAGAHFFAPHFDASLLAAEGAHLAVVALL
jgi:hypothetical protein